MAQQGEAADDVAEHVAVLVVARPADEYVGELARVFEPGVGGESFVCHSLQMFVDEPRRHRSNAVGSAGPSW